MVAALSLRAGSLLQPRVRGCSARTTRNIASAAVGGLSARGPAALPSRLSRPPSFAAAGLPPPPAPHPPRAPAAAAAASRAVSASAAAAEASSSPAASSSAPQDVVAVLRERGLLESVTSEDLGPLSAGQSLAVYCGFDPTAESLHLGNLLGIIVLAWFQRCGHQPVGLVGGATARVGDPSGKSAERPILSEDAIEKNIAGIEATLNKLLRSEGTKIVNNYDWYGGMGFLEFLRDIGKFARVGTMLAKDSVKTRLASDTGISYTEFTYQLLQGYDFVHLNREHGVRVQIGGSDQWGNITAGTDLVRKLGDAPDGDDEDDEDKVYGLTFPLLVGSDGKKFGKSEGGAIWLRSEMLSPYKFYQYLFAIPDADVIKFMKMLTFMDMDEIAKYEADMKADGYLPNTAQKRLAEEVTRFVHGDDGVKQAIAATEGLKPGSDTKLDAAALEALADDIPSVEMALGDVVGATMPDVMAAAGLCKSKSEGRRLIKGGGARLNNEKVSEELYVVKEEDVVEGKLLLLASGKKNKLLVRIEG